MIAAAMDEELQPILRAFGFKKVGDHWSMQRGETQWLAVRFGVGEKSVHDRLKPALENLRPHRLVLVGFSGALDPALRVGEVLRVEHVAGPGEGPFPGYSVTDDLPKQLELGYPSADQTSLFSASFTAWSPEIKATFYKDTQCQLIDMESFFVAALCDEMQLPLQVWRAVSDAAADAIPIPFIGWLRADGTVDKQAAAKYLAIRPWMWGKAWKLARNARRAAAGLVAVLKSEIEKED